MADIILGRDMANKPVTLKEKDFALGGYFIGVRRVGKSYLLEQLILQSITNRRGICVIDPHGDLIENVIGRIPQEKLNDVIYLDPLDADGQFPFALNIYKCENKNNPRLLQYTVDSVMHLFEKLWPAETTQPMVEDVVRVCAVTIIANNMTMVEIPRLILDRAFRNRLLTKITNPDVLAFWESFDNLKPDEQERWGGIVARRVRKFTTNEISKYIVGQSEKTINFRAIIDSFPAKIVLVRLYADMPELTSMIGSMVVSQLLQAALSRSTTDKRPEFHLYCDEYARFATSDFSTIIAEAGKYNIIPFIAHQSRGQITEENQDSAMQLGMLISFRVIGKDSYAIAGEFNYGTNARQKVIPSDVLYHLTDHPSEVVKDFERNIVRRMLEAKGLSIHEKTEKVEIKPQGPGMGIYQSIIEDRTYDVIPEYDFGYGTTGFLPEKLRLALRQLEVLLYAVMKENPESRLMTSPIVEYLATAISIYGLKLVIDAIVVNLRKQEAAVPNCIVDWTLVFADPNVTSQPNYDRFQELYKQIFHVCEELKKDPIYVYPSTGHQESPSEKKDNLASELRGLPQRTARVKVNRRHEGITEHTITTLNQTGRQDYEKKRAQVVAYTRANYCRPRHEVEEEIRRRQSFDTQPTTKRRGI